jgi:4-hydroxy-4-methyl-2-oxoglutarate aldolase
MRNVVVTDPPRADLAQVDELADYGVATVHEALGRTGFLGPALRPLLSGTRIGGPAVTALCWPGDNLMIHVAVEQCRHGDVVVVTTVSPSTDGMFGELLATALQARGARGLIIEAGVRDVARLRSMGFPVWSTAISAQGTVKATAGAVNIPVTVGGQLIRPGDAIIADDDGAVCVPRQEVPRLLAAARERTDREEAAAKAFAAGELSLDRYGMRPLLDSLGVEYLSAHQYAERERDDSASL